MREFYQSVFIITTTTLILFILFNISGALEPPKPQADSEEVPTCTVCRNLVKSFHKGIEKTKREKFEGGDAAWEQDKNLKYSTSEVRLTEIQDDHLCRDVKKGREKCHHLASEYSSEIEEWWIIDENKRPDLFNYLCIDNAKVCCMKGQYGSDCKNCPGYPDNICNNNGKCKGSGTRKGTGKCHCDKGYYGKFCNECAKGFYESYKDENKFLCSSCHAACVDGCTSGGSSNCIGGCKKGWKLNNENNCIDINECLETKNICTGNEFCVNNEGNYSCLSCDKSCDGCTGDGPDMCNKCADGYHEKDNICISKSTISETEKTEL